MAETMADRFALIIASYEYQDPDLRRLIAPAQDAEALGSVLRDPAIGGFKVHTLLNQPSYKVNQFIESLFTDRKRDDLLLLYFSGHGIKDEDGQLYFATADTRRKLLRSTAVPAGLVNDVMRRSRSRQQVLLLDCCYSGAFARGMVAKADREIGTKERFQGRGRVVLTASDAMQYAFEGDSIEGEGARSIFTRTLVEGIETGEADLNGDGEVSLDELYDYVYDRVAEETPDQQPGKWAFDVQGEIVIARNPNPVVKAVELPPELRQAIDNPLSRVREGAARELDRLLHGTHPGLAQAAHAALERLTVDDSRRVIAAADESLTAYAGDQGAREEAERMAAENAEAERIAAKKAEAERMAAEKAEADRIAAEKAEAERIAADKAERMAAEKAEEKRIAAEQAEGERIAVEKAEAERIAEEKAAAGRLAAKQAEAEPIAEEKAEAGRIRVEETATGVSAAAPIAFVERLRRLPAWGWALSGLVALGVIVVILESDTLFPTPPPEIIEMVITVAPTFTPIPETTTADIAPQFAELRILLASHTREVRGVAWSPDGTQLASGSSDGTVRVWDAATGEELRVVGNHAGGVMSVAWSPDGTRLASGSADKSLQVWDAATGEQLRVLTGHTDTVASVAWSPDGTLLASGSADKSVQVWDAASGEKLRVLAGHTGDVTGVAWSPDGSQLASVSRDGTARVWDAASGEELLAWRGRADELGGMWSVAWSHDGTQLAAGGTVAEVWVWDGASTGQMRVTASHGGPVFSVAWSPDGTTLASASIDRLVAVRVAVRDVATGENTRFLEGHTDSVWSVAWSPDGTQLASGSSDGTIRIWGNP